jgi:hypothetical protein
MHDGKLLGMMVKELASKIIKLLYKYICMYVGKRFVKLVDCN